MQELVIDKKIQSLAPPLSDEGLAELEQSLLENGCLSRLVVWSDVLLNGHKRYKICRKHGIPYTVGYVMLNSLEDAKAWIKAHYHNPQQADAVDGEETTPEREHSLPIPESQWYHPVVDQSTIDEIAEETEKYVLMPTRFAKKLIRMYQHGLCRSYVFSQLAADEVFDNVLGHSVAKALQKYDPERGAKFSTYVYSRLRYDIIREFRLRTVRFCTEHSGLDLVDRESPPASADIEQFKQPKDQKNPKPRAILSPTNCDRNLLFPAYWSTRSTKPKHDEDEDSYYFEHDGGWRSTATGFSDGNRQNGGIVEFPSEDRHLQEVEVKDFFERCSVITDEEISSLSRRYLPRSMRGMKAKQLKEALAEIDLRILWCIWNGRSLTEERESYEESEARKTKRKQVNHRKFFESRRKIIMAKVTKFSAEREKS